MVLSFNTLNEAVVIPPKLTALAPVKPAPLIVTKVPTQPVAGVKELIVVNTKTFTVAVPL